MALSEDELEGAFEGSSREGEKFFSDPTVYLERYLHDPRHVEVQVLADRHGNVIHLGERDCSIQRRHQKVIEESPAPEWIVDPETRARIGEIGVNAAKAVDYVGAGTIEGLFSAHQGAEPEYFFLEMNTRVQVEHCVTEMTTGIDIVKEGIRAAAGDELAYAQEDVGLRGHSIECRINAEDASKNFAPAPGKIGRYREPKGPGVRVDSGVEEGGEVSPMYDPMVAKLIVWDVDREQATRRMLRALGEYEIEGLKTLIPFHTALLESEQWARGDTCRELLEDKKWLKTLAFPKPEAPPEGSEEAETVEQTYEVEVSGRRFDVRVVGPAARRRRRLQRGHREGGAQARRAQVDQRRRPGHAALAAAGQHVEGPRQTGRHGHRGPAALHHRGDEDGERDHRAQGRHDHRAADLRGRADPGRRADRDDQEPRGVLERSGVRGVQPALRRRPPAVRQLRGLAALAQRAQIGQVLLQDPQRPLAAPAPARGRARRVRRGRRAAAAARVCACTPRRRRRRRGWGSRRRRGSRRPRAPQPSPPSRPCRRVCGRAQGEARAPAPRARSARGPGAPEPTPSASGRSRSIISSSSNERSSRWAWPGEACRRSAVSCEQPSARSGNASRPSR